MKNLALVALAVALTSTPAAAQPTSYPRVGKLAELRFAPSSEKLGPNVSIELGKIAAWANDNPDGLVVLDSHSDPNGSRTANVRLSVRRGQTVRSELVRLGIDADRIVIAAYGESGPRGSADRRVVAWGTRAGMQAVLARTRARGKAVIVTGLVSAADLPPQPGAVANR